MVKTKLTLDMNRKSITPRIIAKQLDSGRKVEITVNCDGVLVTDSFDETRVLTAKGNDSFYSSSLAEKPIIENLSNGKTTWKIPSDVLGVPGITIGELRLIKDGFVVSSMPFEIYVEAAVSSSDAKMPKNAVDFIKRAEDAAEKANEEYNKAASSERDSRENALRASDMSELAKEYRDETEDFRNEANSFASNAADAAANAATSSHNAEESETKANEYMELTKEYRDEVINSLGDTERALDEIIAIQEALINGNYSKNITLTDEATGSQYQISVSNAKVILEEV